MIHGMTGFGSAQIAAGDIKMVIEIKSVNHRYLDIVFYLPTGFASVENKIRQTIQKKVKRGRITVSVKIAQKSTTAAALNKEVVKKYIKYALSLRREFHLKNDLTVADLIRLPGVLEVKESYVTPDQVEGALDNGIQRALKGLLHMRNREGRALTADVSKQLKKMIQQTKKIQKRAALILKHRKKQLSPDEFASLQKGTDVNEETSRLLHYFDEIKNHLKSQASIGKKIDFIAQEMQRETNTIGSKLQDKTVSNEVISLKSAIEKIREQAQNIE